MSGVLDCIRLSSSVSVPPVALAPMSAVTDAPFRNVVRSLGGGYLVSEMIVSRDTIAFEKSSAKKSQGTSDAVQLAGNDPYLMAEAARISVDGGARIIDINFGCPAKKIVNSYCGAFIMRDEKLACSIIDAVVAAVKVPVTVKMRLGWDCANVNVGELAKIAEDSGAAMLAIHARTRAQFYSGRADWKAVRIARESTKLPIFINGDITSHGDAISALSLSGANGVMVGRASYGRPWLIGSMLRSLHLDHTENEPSFRDKCSIMFMHIEGIFEFYGSATGVGLAKKHASWYSKGMNNSAGFRAALCTVQTKGELITIIKRFFVE